MIYSVIDWPLFYVNDQLLLFYWSSFDLNELWLLLLQTWSRTESPSSAGASRTRTRRCPGWLWWPGLTYSWPHQQTLPGRRPVFLIKTVRCYWGVGDTVRGGANIQEMRGYWTLYVQKLDKGGGWGAVRFEQTMSVALLQESIFCQWGTAWSDMLILEEIWALSPRSKREKKNW